MPSPVDDRPGLLMRDPFRYTDQNVIVPPLLARALHLFDGEHAALDLRAYLAEATGELEVGEVADHFVNTLEQGGFLESETYFRLREAKHQAFRDAPEKLPAHAGGAYPDEPEELTAQLREWGAQMNGVGGAGTLVALAAPHVSPEGGYQSYAAAYNRLRPEHASKTFVILGTSHYGESERWGLTRKAYATPLGAVETDQAIVDRLAQAAPGAVEMEDYCHASEHSIEFQTVYLQHMLGPHLPPGERLRAVPILCGGLADSLVTGRPAESNDDVRAFFDALGEIAEERDDLVFILGIDLAHIGRRYGDQFEAVAEEGRLIEVRKRDEERLAAVAAGDLEQYFHLLHPNHDDLRWCGYGPLYTFLASVKAPRGQVLSYEQWNIDEQSVVSFTGMEFRREDQA